MVQRCLVEADPRSPDDVQVLGRLADLIRGPY